MAYTFLEFAYDVLQISEIALTYQEIWNKGIEMNLDKKLSSTGKTPWHSLGARLFVEVRDNLDSKFVKVSKNPAKFTLKNLDVVNKANKIPTQNKKNKNDSTFLERDLHPLLSYFVSSNPAFGRGKTIYTKTIFHEVSKRNGYNEWLHPDMVGFYLPIDDWKQNLIEFNRLTDNNVVKLFSFELKKAVNKGNYRESFFQAVSNSSWANEGYLVTAERIEDDDLLSELERLSTSFGIGVIYLNIEDFDSTQVLFPATVKLSMDWETMNKLCEQNKDFDKFIQDVKIDFESKKIHPSEYDPIIKNPINHIDKILKKGF